MHLFWYSELYIWVHLSGVAIKLIKLIYKHLIWRKNFIGVQKHFCFFKYLEYTKLVTLPTCNNDLTINKLSKYVLRSLMTADSTKWMMENTCYASCEIKIKFT